MFTSLFRSNLIQHRTVHKRPYNCHLCNKRFDKEDQLKKHLFAHPQALIHCTLCKFAAANQAELNKHIMEAHASVVQEGLKKNGEGVSPPQLSPRGDRQTEPITPPSVTGSPQDLSQQSSNSPTQIIRPSKGHRIDAICNQLSTSIASISGGDERFHGVIIKKEGEEGMMNGEGLVRIQPGDAMYPVSSMSTGVSADLPRASVAALYTTPQLPAGISQEDINRAMEEANKSLPGIQEMFSRRTPNLPMSLPNYGMPLAIAANSGLPPGHPELPGLLMSPPPTSFTGIPTQRPPPLAPIPPPTQDSSGNCPGGTKRDQAVQHTAPIPGFPSLEDVLAYYMGQGKLFKCQHCDVMFFERGMYFLHASLHGHSSPWECSICHKICSDKNEFTIHFVNQQHNS